MTMGPLSTLGPPVSVWSGACCAAAGAGWAGADCAWAAGRAQASLARTNIASRAASRRWRGSRGAEDARGPAPTEPGSRRRRRRVGRRREPRQTGAVARGGVETGAMVVTLLTLYSGLDGSRVY